MSLFGSIYDDDALPGGVQAVDPDPDRGPDDAVEPAPEPVRTQPGAQSEDDSLTGSDHEESAGSEEGGVPVHTIEAPDMSLHAFASQVFADQADGDGSPDPGLDGEDAPPGLTSAMPDSPPPPAPATDEVLEPPAAASQPATTMPDASLAPTRADAIADTVLPEALLDDDFLPAGSGRSSPRLAAPGPGLVKAVALVAIVAVLGLLTLRALSSGGDSEASDSPGSGAPVAGLGGPANVGEALATAQLVGAESEIRQALTAAQVWFAETGTFARPAGEWGLDVPQLQIVAATGAPETGILHVVSDDDTVCFETLATNGTTVAGAATFDRQGFTTDESGAALCTADAAVVAGWSPSLARF